MFRILIVEDFKGTLEQLRVFISAAFKEPDGEASVCIHTAESVSEAKEVIEVARLKKRAYHAVVLDFMLPPRPGYDTSIDESLCLTVRDSMKSTLVAHITMYSEDPLVKDHLRRIHQEQVDPHAFALSKAGGDYAIELVLKLKAFLYGKRIEEQMDTIFGEQEELSFAARGRATRNRPRTERSLTLDIATLRRDIVAHWADIDPELKTKIKHIFRVDTETSPIRLSLLKES